jgi:rhamnogalacturonan endolyase
MKVFFWLMISSIGFALPVTSQNLLYSDSFASGLKNWTSESESDSTLFICKNNSLEIITPEGLTLWFNKPLEGNVRITYDALVVSNKGKYDRVSDLNCFWAASDPEHPENLFERSKWRKGVFGKYYSLCLYYVGYGGNSNSTTRFRKYNGDYQNFISGNKQPDIIKEYTDSAHLIKPNCWSNITIEMNGDKIRYIFNHEVLFDYYDPQPYTKGYFAIRTVTNHMIIKNFMVVKNP